MKNIFKLIALSLVVAFANAVNITVDDFHGLNTLTTANGAANNNNAAITKTLTGGDGVSSLTLAFGAGTSANGYDGYGTGTSTFGQSGAWFDGSYLKFANSGNQMKVDFRITNNSTGNKKLTNLDFDIRTTSGAVTNYQLSYLDAGDSDLRKGASFAAGSELNNLQGMGSGTISTGINNFSEAIGGNIGGQAWIERGGYANIRLILTGTGAAQLDNFVVTMAVPEPSTYALLSGLFIMAWISLRRRSVK